MKRENGKSYFYQWELNQRLIVEEECKMVQFGNGTMTNALGVEVKKGYAEVPNILLQTPAELHAYAWDDNTVVGHSVFQVLPMPKPAQYAYTQTEVKQYDLILKELEDLRTDGDVIHETAGKSVREQIKKSKALIVTIDADGEANFDAWDIYLRAQDGRGAFLFFEEQHLFMPLAYVDSDVAIFREYNLDDGTVNEYRVNGDNTVDSVLKKLDMNALLVVTLSDDGTVDYPANEIYEHIQAGGTAVLKAGDDYLPFAWASENCVEFACYEIEDNVKTVWQITNDARADCYEDSIASTHYVDAQFRGGVVFNDTANNKAGELAAAFGEETKALGKGSFAGGTKKTRSGGNDAVSGDVYYTEAVGSGSMASGMGAVAFSRASKSLGYRTQTGYPPSAEWVENRTGVTVKVDAQGNNVFPGDNVGQGAVAMGSDTVALENHTFAGGYKSKAIATASFAYGSENVTKGNCSVAMGSHNEANNECAVALGANSKAERKWSFAANNSTIARGNCSSAFGDGTVTAQQYDENGNNIPNNPGYAQMVVGRYNAYEDGEIDRALFVVGNGAKNQETQEVVRSNAFIVDRDGNTYVKGKLSFGSVDDASAQMVRGIESGHALPSKGNFNGQIFMLNEAVNEIVSESGITWNDKTTVYIWSDAFDVGWIKIGEKVGELGIGFEP